MVNKMNTVYSLIYFECDLNTSEFKVETHGPKPFSSEEDALNYLVRLIKPKLKTKFEELLYKEGKGEGDMEVSEAELNDVIFYSTSCGAKGLKRLLDLYFKNVGTENFYTGYKINAFSTGQAISNFDKNFFLTN